MQYGQHTAGNKIQNCKFSNFEKFEKFSHNIFDMVQRDICSNLEYAKIAENKITRFRKSRKSLNSRIAYIRHLRMSIWFSRSRGSIEKIQKLKDIDN